MYIDINQRALFPAIHNGEREGPDQLSELEERVRAGSAGVLAVVLKIDRISSSDGGRTLIQE